MKTALFEQMCIGKSYIDVDLSVLFMLQGHRDMNET